MFDLKNTLQKLCAAFGTPGAEDAAAYEAAAFLSAYATVSRDPLGSVIGVVDGEKDSILLDAHIDQIGLIVTEVDKSGFLRFTRCGNADERLLAGAEVTVCGKEPLFGVITSTPPHLSDPDERGKAKSAESLFIDVGFPEEKTKALVSPGDSVVFNGKFSELLNGRVASAALDDRAGIAVILYALELLKDKKHNRRIIVSFSAREEVGGSGAAAAAFTAEPKEAIAIDVSFGDFPEADTTETKKLGGGPMIGCSPVLNREMTAQLKAAADKNGIPYSLEVMGGLTSTNADRISISGRGVKTALISVPLRNMHSACEVASLGDIENCARLIAAYIDGGDSYGN